MGNNSISAWSMLSILGGLIAMISVFMMYVSVDCTMNNAGFIISTKSEFTGLEIVQGGLSINSLLSPDGDDFSLMSYLPAITAVFGGLCAVMGLVSMTLGCRRCNVVTLILSIFGILSAMGFVILGVGEGLFDGTMKDIVSGLIEAGTVNFNISPGAYLAILGSILALMGSTISAHKVLG